MDRPDGRMLSGRMRLSLAAVLVALAATLARLPAEPEQGGGSQGDAFSSRPASVGGGGTGSGDSGRTAASSPIHYDRVVAKARYTLSPMQLSGDLDLRG